MKIDGVYYMKSKNRPDVFVFVMAYLSLLGL
jgi:hypothetical protein